MEKAKDFRTLRIFDITYSKTFILPMRESSSKKSCTVFKILVLKEET